MLTQERLKELLSYNKETGEFTRLKDRGTRKIGDEAGHNIEGYTYIGIDNKTYPAHRLAFLYVDGVYPLSDVDHKDMNRGNNKWDNLRISTRRLNMLNMKAHQDNPLGFKNVSYRKDTGKYSVRITINGKYKAIGCFDDLDLANLVADAAREKYHGEYARNS